MNLRKITVILAAVAMLAVAAPASADTGTVTVSGTNSPTIRLTISDGTAVFGSSLRPDGTGATGEISAVTGSGTNEGAYYIWTPSATPNITVKSNMVWNGTVAASENTGGSDPSTTMKVSDTAGAARPGALRYCSSVPATYAAAASCTALSTTAASYASNVPAGTNTRTHYVALRVDWDDDPGTFDSTVTYIAIQ